ncbi:uncharacterized protein [Nicotiana sylvestris]|uniref:uncharacterized protein n=1 Tax=Nicotiana sylvestris TaxID=4096 RepID=UPI00388CBAC9
MGNALYLTCLYHSSDVTNEAEDSELWDIISDRSIVPTKTIRDPAVTVPKARKEYNDVDRKAIEKNFRAKKILVCGIGPDEYNRISACQYAKEIWEALHTAHEGTTQVKQSKIDMLPTEYELFRMKDDESIQDMHSRFTSIINELHSLGEIIPRKKLVRKILSVLPGSWESKVNAITETYELKKKKDNDRRDPKREKNPVLKTDNNDSGGEDADMAYLTKKFQKMVRRNGDQYKHNTNKASKRNSIPDKRFKRKDVADNVVKQALATWGNSSSESEEDDDQGDNSMMAVESEAAEYDSIFALIAKSNDDDEGDDDDDEGAVKGSIQQWYMDSGCSKHMNGMVLVAKGYKNIYVADFESLQNGDLSCLTVVDDDVELWHRRLSHASFTLLHKLVKKDLVRGLPKSSFKDHKIQVKMSYNVVCIRSDHGTKFDNAKFDKFCTENGITHNFSAPKTPQQNDVVERENRTLEDMARTMLIDSSIA